MIGSTCKRNSVGVHVTAIGRLSGSSDMINQHRKSFISGNPQGSIEKSFQEFVLAFHTAQGACGAMDNASDYGSEDSRFESWQARRLFTLYVRQVQIGTQPQTTRLQYYESGQLLHITYGHRPLKSTGRHGHFLNSTGRHRP